VTAVAGDKADADRRSALGWLWLAVSVVLLDQLSKQIAAATLKLYHPVRLAPSVNLTLMHNTGAAFSMLNQAGGWQRWLFVALGAIVGAVIVWWLRRLPAERRWLACALALILGGAAGNVIDRIFLGYVVDFIDVYYGRWHWPAFNIADSAITIGAVMLLIDAFRKDGDTGGPQDAG
jgi:signal peptidase II